MIKLQIVSDLHLEFSDIEIKNNGADVLILAGDILVAEPMHQHPLISGELSEEQLDKLGPHQLAAYRFRNFLRRVSTEFKDVIYIAGNHEFYNGCFNSSLIHLKDECSKFGNIHFLENETITISDTTFIGCTLWTDLDRLSPHAMFDAQNMMNDYRKIRFDQGVPGNLYFSKLKPENTAYRHYQSLQYIKRVIDNQPNAKYVVVGHHAPSHLSVHESYRGQSTNYAYYSDLSELILDSPQIKLWIHGHTHTSFDYNIGDTRIICNPRGYCHHTNEQRTGWNQDLIIEV